MISTAHMLTGAAIAANSDSWPVVLLASFLSHFVLDVVPHWDPDYQRWPRQTWFIFAFLDLLVGFLLVFWLMGEQLNGLTFLAMMAGILPDILTITALYFKSKLGKKFVAWHKSLQNIQTDWRGMLSQLFLVLAMGVIIVISRELN